MSGISVHKVDPAKPKSVSLLNEVESVFDQVQRRAFELFEQRGPASGNEMDDWLNAEAEFVFAPASKLVEGEKNFEIHVAAPGFSSDELNVSVLPDCIIVSGKAEAKKDQNKGTVHFSELRRKDLLRRFYMPNLIDSDQVHASLQDGLLTIVAKKAAAVARKPVAVETGMDVQERKVAV